MWLLPYLGWTAHQRRAKKTVSLFSHAIGQSAGVKLGLLTFSGPFWGQLYWGFAGMWLLGYGQRGGAALPQGKVGRIEIVQAGEEKLWGDLIQAFRT